MKKLNKDLTNTECEWILGLAKQSVKMLPKQQREEVRVKAREIQESNPNVLVFWEYCVRHMGVSHKDILMGRVYYNKRDRIFKKYYDLKKDTVRPLPEDWDLKQLVEDIGLDIEEVMGELHVTRDMAKNIILYNYPVDIVRRMYYYEKLLDKYIKIC